MTEQIELIKRKLDHLSRMPAYLTYSLEQSQQLMPILAWECLTPEDHATLAAFRVRFSDFQEHLGKTMRAIAIEEEQRTEPFTAVLLYMEKLDIIDSAQAWKRAARTQKRHQPRIRRKPPASRQVFSRIGIRCSDPV